MKRPVLSALPVATFATAAAVMLSGAGVARAQTDVETACKNSGGEYSSEQVQPHWGAEPTLIETCCTGSGGSRQCVTYRDGVPGPAYKSG